MIKRNIQITRVSRVADREPPPATRASYKYKLMFKYIIKFENSTHIANAKYKNYTKTVKIQQLTVDTDDGACASCVCHFSQDDNADCVVCAVVLNDIELN